MALGGEELRSVGCDVHVVFEAYAELTAQVDARLV
jgi:hypothetical protein